MTTTSSDITMLRVHASSAALLLAMTLVACAPAASPPSSTSPSPSNAALASDSGLTLADAESCPVTKPGQAPERIGSQLFGSASAFGNGELWVGGLGDDGVILADTRFVESDGSIGWKLGWWRIAHGTLTITGRRLDRDAPPLRSSVPDGYGSSGFQASGVSFPTPGCWEVTGAVDGGTLTFVVFVVRTS